MDELERLKKFLRGDPADMSVPQLAKAYHQLHLEGAKLRQQLRVIETCMQLLENFIVSKMTQEDTSAITVADRTYYLATQELPKIEDWAALSRWIVEYEAPDILQKRVSATALRDYVEQGLNPEGVSVERLLRLRNRTR